MERCMNSKQIIEDKMSEYRRYCKCGHSITVAPIGLKEYFLCSWCGGRIYRDLQKQKEYDEKCSRDEFKFKFSQILKNQ